MNETPPYPRPASQRPPEPYRHTESELRDSTLAGFIGGLLLGGVLALVAIFTAQL